MNSKGFTTVEVLICFVMVSVIMMSMFSVISSFNEKKIEESTRSKIISYKNQVTNAIQEDIVKKGLQYVKEITPCNDSNTDCSYQLSFGDGTVKTLKIHRVYTQTTLKESGDPGVDDEFYIDYGTDSLKTRFDLPDVGSTKGTYYTKGGVNVFEPADINGNCHADCRVAKDLQIGHVEVYVVANETNSSAQIFKLMIELYHPDFGHKYEINVVAPINYRASVASQSEWPVSKDPSNKKSEEYIYYYSDLPW